MKHIAHTAISLVFITIAIFFICGCHDPKPATSYSTTINFSPNFGDGQIALNKLYATNAGDSIKITMAKILLSNITLTKKDNSTQVLKDVAFYGTGQNFVANLSAKANQFVSGDFVSISFNFGLTDEQNNTDPTVACPNPLCADNDMWWGNSLKFTHIKLEGNVKAAGSSTFNVLLYHVGTPANRKTITISQPISLANNKDNSLTITLDVKKILDGTVPMNMNTEIVTQTTDHPAVATKFADNIVNAFSVK